MERRMVLICKAGDQLPGNVSGVMEGVGMQTLEDI